jgi:hypothetical protein
MKKKSIIIAVLLSAGIIATWGCGSGPGSPGSGNTEDLGVTVNTTISFAGNATVDVQSPNVDAFQDVCTAETATTAAKMEPFRDHPAQLTFDARLLNPNTTFQVGTLFIEKYTVTFRRKNDSITSPPIETFVGNERVTIVPPTGNGVTTVTTTLMFVDLRRKFAYRDAFCSSWFFFSGGLLVGNSCTPVGQFSSTDSFINNYTATYTFEGQNSFGKSFVLTAQTDFSIGDFANCP